MSSTSNITQVYDPSASDAFRGRAYGVPGDKLTKLVNPIMKKTPSARAVQLGEVAKAGGLAAVGTVIAANMFLSEKYRPSPRSQALLLMFALAGIYGGDRVSHCPPQDLFKTSGSL
jgi:hypothetical protein